MNAPRVVTRTICLALLLGAAPALAATPSPGPSLEPRYDLVKDGAVTGATAASVLTLLALQKQLGPTRCHWCAPPGVDAHVSRSLRWHDPDLADKGSTGLALALGAGALGYGVLEGYQRGNPRGGWANALLVTEATSVAMLLDTSVKYAVGRQRPYARRGESKPGDAHDRNLSFFSMHSTFAFAVASSSSTLLLEQRAPHAQAYAIAAFGAAAAVGYLRVAADRHYASDVLVGAGVGTALGWAIPHFFHPAKESGVQLVPSPGGIAVVF